MRKPLVIWDICVFRLLALVVVPGLQFILTGPIPQIEHQPWRSNCVCLFLVLQLKFVVVTLSTQTQCLLIYTYFLSIMWEISKLLEISLQEIFSIFLIGYNWSHSVHFHFVIQLLQLFYIDMMLICEEKHFARFTIFSKNIS